MKIFQLCAIDQTMTVFLRQLILKLIEEGHDVVGICSEGPYTQDLRKENIKVINIEIERKIKPISNLKSILQLIRLFKNENPDILHVHTPIASVLGRIAAKIAKVPIIIYTAHGFYFHEEMPYWKYKLILLIEKFLAKYFTDFIFTQSGEDRQTAVDNKFLRADKILTIGNGVDVYRKFNPSYIVLEDIEKLYKELNIAIDTRIITFVGRLVKEKGILDLLEAFTNGQYSNTKLLVVGDLTQGSRDEKTKQVIFEKYSHNPNIIFTGYRNDINNLLFITDLFCLPSYREGMPRSIIEAMAMECAVVATNIRGTREEVVEGHTGFLVNLASPQELKERFDLLLWDGNLLGAMKNEGRKRAVEVFWEGNVVKRQIAVIRELEASLEINKG